MTGYYTTSSTIGSCYYCNYCILRLRLRLLLLLLLYIYTSMKICVCVKLR